MARRRNLLEPLEERILLTSTLTYTASSSGTVPVLAATFEVPKFDSNYGTLRTVDLTVTGHSIGGANYIENGGLVPGPASVTMGTQINVAGPSALIVLVLPKETATNPAVPPNDGIFPDTAGPDTFFIIGDYPSDTGYDSLVSPAAGGVDDVTPYIGPGNVTFNWSSAADTTFFAGFAPNSNVTVSPQFDFTATIVYTYSAPQIVARKTDTLLIDNDGNGVVSAGDTLQYTVTIANTGDDVAKGVMFTDAITDPYLRLIHGSVTSSQGTVITGNGAGDGNNILVSLGSIPVGGLAVVTMQVQIDPNIPASVTSVYNAALISGYFPPDYPSDRTPLGLTYAYDVMHVHGRVSAPTWLPEVTPLRKTILPPLYSGTAEPGTTLEVSLYDPGGLLMGYNTVIADAGGNWQAPMPDAELTDQPHALTIRQWRPNYDLDNVGVGRNLRTYFAPAFSSVFVNEQLTDESVMLRRRAYEVDALYDGALYPLNLGWTKYRYEYLTAPGIPLGGD